jgi:two-component system KDP operon response regulator KdpE
MNKTTVMIIEDEKGIGNFIAAVLEHNEYNVLKANTGNEAVSLISSHMPDLILLDLGLPDMDGLEVLKMAKQFSSAPIIVVSARDMEKEKVEALDLGADDYISKPFGTNELLARIRLALRHLQNAAVKGEADVFQFRGLSVNYEKRLVTLEGKEIHLTPIEYKIIVLFTHHPGKVLTHSFIIKEVWGPYASESQALRVNMANIRRKIEKNPAEPLYILTEVGVGYRLAE